MYIICSYIPPSSPIAIYEQHGKAVELICSKLKSCDSIILVGDFNIPSLSWQVDAITNYLIPIFSIDAPTEFINGISNNSLTQINNVVNSSGRWLDLIFVSDPDDFSHRRTLPLRCPEDRHHPTIEIIFSYSYSHTNDKPTLEKQFCFKKTDYQLLNTLLSQINWIELFSNYNDNLDLSITTFYNLLHDCFLDSVPKILPSKSTGPPWNTKYLSKLKNKKNKMFKKYKDKNTPINYKNYSVARSEFNIENNSAYKNYINKMKNNLKDDPKSFYKFVNSKRRSVDFPSTMKYNGLESSDDISISNMFAKFFASTYSSSLFNNSQYPYSIEQSTSIIIPSLNEVNVSSNLSKLKMSYVSGPDGVPTCILKRCSNLLCTPLTYLFNLSLKLGYFPEAWKDSFIIPLFKTGSKSSISNYRGIAKLSAIPKLFEKLITEMLSHQVSSLLSPKQHGFRKSRSTITNLLELTSIVNDGFIKKKQTDAVYTDFSKAFDKVNHDLLLFKLDLLGFSVMLLKWIESYLKNRKQYVKFRNSKSNYIYVSSGVPQGSHLGPLLFTLFINDLPKVIKYSQTLMYADDVKIFLSFNNTADQALLQYDIINFTTWCEDNLMDLNTKKCKYMIFSRTTPINGCFLMNNEPLELVQTFNDLGILLDKQLDFRAHVSTTINKAMGVLGFIKRWAKEFSDPYTTKQLYTTLVRPILEYGSVVWDPSVKIRTQSIESVQKQFLLFCLRGLGWVYNNEFPSYNNRLALIKLPTLKSRRQMLNVTFVLKLLKGFIDSEFLLGKLNLYIPAYSTRNYEFLRLSTFQTNYAKADPFRKICEEFNQLYFAVDFNKNLDAVKRDIILHLNKLKHDIVIFK